MPWADSPLGCLRVTASGFTGIARDAQPLVTHHAVIVLRFGKAEFRGRT